MLLFAFVAGGRQLFVFRGSICAALLHLLLQFLVGFVVFLQLFLALAYFSGQRVSPIDDGASVRQVVLGLQRSLAGCQKFAAYAQGVRFARGDVAHQLFLARLERFDVAAAHGDFTKEGLHALHGVIALYLELFVARSDACFVRFVLFLLASRHCCLGLALSFQPVELSVQQIGTCVSVPAGCEQEVASLFLLGQIFGRQTVAQDAGNLVFYGLLAPACLVGQLINFLRDTSVDLCAGQFLEQGGLVAALGFQEVGKAVLGQQYRPRELQVVQSDDFRQTCGNFALVYGLLLRT